MGKNFEIDEKNYKKYRNIPKPKPGEIFIFPKDNRLDEVSPYVNTQANQPSWFRMVGKHLGSIRRCAGTVDYLSSGVTIPMWTNTYFNPRHEGNFGWEIDQEHIPFPAHGEFRLQHFDYQSTGKCPMTQMRHEDAENGVYPKLVSPFNIMTAPGWSTIMLPVLFEPNKNYQVIPAIVNTDIYHEANIVLNIITNEHFKITAGTAIAHLIPFKRNADFSKIKFMDQQNFILTTSRGFSEYQRFPVGSSSSPYRRYSRQIDEEIERMEKSKKSILGRFFK